MIKVQKYKSCGHEAITDLNFISRLGTHLHGAVGAPPATLTLINSTCRR